MYLLDTYVVSELRRPQPHGAVVAWLRGVADADLHLSAVTIGELQAGVEITREQDPKRAAEIEAWVGRVADSYNVLPMDAPAFRAWARLMHGRSQALLEDAMIAATAEVHGLIVVTRNVRDFVGLGARMLNPFRHPRGWATGRELPHRDFSGFANALPHAPARCRHILRGSGNGLVSRDDPRGRNTIAQ